MLIKIIVLSLTIRREWGSEIGGMIKEEAEDQGSRQIPSGKEVKGRYWKDNRVGVDGPPNLQASAQKTLLLKAADKQPVLKWILK